MCRLEERAKQRNKGSANIAGGCVQVGDCEHKMSISYPTGGGFLDLGIGYKAHKFICPFICLICFINMLNMPQIYMSCFIGSCI